MLIQRATRLVDEYERNMLRIKTGVDRIESKREFNL